MKKWLMFLGLPCALMAGERTKDEYHALSLGAEACAALKVVDDTGAAVTNATVMGNFHMHDGKGNPFTGHTDTGGVYVASGKCVGDWHYVIKKAGHYETSVDVRYFSPTNTSVSNGRWQPYGLTNTVVLKRKVNPVSMAVVTHDSQHHDIPVVGKGIGFDLFENDWVSPNGKGKYADFHMQFDWDGSKYAEYNGSALTFSFKDAYAGAYKIKNDGFSGFKSPYRADTNAVFAQEVKFSYIRGRKASETFNGQLNGDECLILRVRTKVDKEGNLLSACYAKIYGPMMFGYAIKTPGSMGMQYYLNPNENDPNLEADSTKNLLNPGDLGFAP